MSWRPGPERDDEDLTAFERAQLQALHALVRGYEATQKQLNDLIFWLATRIAPGEVDRRQIKTPFAFTDMTPGQWRQFFEEALKDVHLSHGLTPVSPDALNLEREARQLRERLAAAEARIAELRVIAADAAEIQDDAAAGPTPEIVPPPAAPSDPQEVIIPGKPPASYQSLFSRQEESRKRELIFLALLAGKGYSAELGLRWELVQRIDGVANPDSGSLRRLILRMEKNKLLQRLPIAMGKYRIIIVILTELGETVARSMAITPVESEWARLMRLHGGDRQQKHAAQVCLFTHYARRGGWTTQVCPAADPPADPDVLLEKAGQRIYVEVEAGSGSVERRMKKWRNQRHLQGFTALCAPTEHLRRILTAEASAGGHSGMATDFEWLRAQRVKAGDRDVKLKETIWAQKW